MLIITGPGRSGTSVLALYCQKMGYDPGGEWCDVLNAGLEDRRVVTINDALLRELRETGTARQTLMCYGEQMRQLRAGVVKDPRFTFHPGVLSAWQAVRDDLSVMVTYRTPEHCCASRQRQAHFLRDRRSNSPDMIRHQIADSIEALLTLGIPFQMLLFPKFLEQFEQVYSGLRELGLELERNRAERVWYEVVDQNKVHIGGGASSDQGAEQNRPLAKSLTTDAYRLWKRVFPTHDKPDKVSVEQDNPFSLHR